MLIRFSQNYRGLSKPLLCFWLLFNSMVFCAFSAAAAEAGGAQLSDSLTQPHATHSHATHAHSTHSNARGMPGYGHHPAADMHHSACDHYHFTGAMQHSMGDQHHSHGTGHGSDCCGEAKATNSASASFVELPASAMVLILLVFCFGTARSQINNRYLKQPLWSPPSIPLLHCSFLK